MKVTLKKAFNLLDGRLSTKMEDVYEMLNFIFSANFMTHELGEAFDKLIDLNPVWFSEGAYIIQQIVEEYKTNDFAQLMKIIDENYSETFIQIEVFKPELLK